MGIRCYKVEFYDFRASWIVVMDNLEVSVGVH